MWTLHAAPVKKSCIFKTLVLLPLLFMTSVPVHAAGRAQDPGDKVVVVIDPGHGGENLGTTQNAAYMEKDLTMTTALAMYDELSRFEGVEVYLTRTEDQDLTLKERAEFAEEKDADLLVSIHYNASESHASFGSEVWISLEPEYHAYGYQFATVVMRQFQDLGMHLRGIKTRVDSKGKDYYGVIRESVALGIPAVIVEHCHVDQAEDALHCDTEEDQRAFGVSAAHAVAKYFGLKSDSLGVDYSDYPATLPDVSLTEMVPRAKYDDTPPEACTVELDEAFYSEGRVLLSVKASDKDSNLIYYTYSLDGGKNFSKLQAWPVGDILTGVYEEGFLLELEIPDGVIPDICVRAYNAYDLFSESNILHFTQAFGGAESQEEGGGQGQGELAVGGTDSSEDAEMQDGTSDLVPAGTPLSENSSAVEDVLSVLRYLIPVVFLIFLILLILYLFSGGGHSGQTR